MLEKAYVRATIQFVKEIKGLAMRTLWTAVTIMMTAAVAAAVVAVAAVIVVATAVAVVVEAKLTDPDCSQMEGTVWL